MEVHEHIHTARKNGSIISEFRLRRNNVVPRRVLRVLILIVLYTIKKKE